jgi:hypothetical protein
MPQTFPGRKLELSNLGKPQYDEFKQLLLGDERKNCLAYCYFQFAERNMILETSQREDKQCAKLDSKLDCPFAECLRIGDYLGALLLFLLCPLAILVALLVTFSPPFMPRNQARRGKVY